MRRRKKEQSQTQKIKEAVTLTGALFHKELHIEMVSNKEALIDGCKGIVEYNENIIRLNIPEGQIQFRGRGLEIACMSEESMIVRGYIMGLEFCH